MPPHERPEREKPLSKDQGARPGHPGLGRDRAALVESRTAACSPLETRRTDIIILCFIHILHSTAYALKIVNVCCIIIVECFQHK